MLEMRISGFNVKLDWREGTWKWKNSSLPRSALGKYKVSTRLRTETRLSGVAKIGNVSTMTFRGELLQVKRVNQNLGRRLPTSLLIIGMVQADTY